MGSIKLRLGLESEGKAKDPTGTPEDQRALEHESQSLILWAKDNGITAERKETSVPGTKGIEIAIGTLILTTITAKLINDLYDYIKMRIQTRASKGVRYKIIYYEGGEEKELEINASNYKKEKTAGAMRLVQNSLVQPKGG